MAKKRGTPKHLVFIRYIHSENDPKKSYRIFIDKKRSYKHLRVAFACDCKGYIFSKENPKNCKHIKMVFREILTDETGWWFKNIEEILEVEINKNGWFLRPLDLISIGDEIECPCGVTVTTNGLVLVECSCGEKIATV